MSRVQHLVVGEDEADQRLDRWFKAHFPGLTHGQLEKLLRKGDIRVDKKRSKANDRLEVDRLCACRLCRTIYISHRRREGRA